MNSYYELTYIISPVLEDEQYPAVIQRINDLVTSNGGAIEVKNGAFANLPMKWTRNKQVSM